jgi:hypothetical protein
MGGCNDMSGFTEACRDQARAAWGAAASLTDKYSKRNEGRSLGNRAGTGCLGLLVFWVPLFLVLFMVFVAIEAALIAYALLVSLLWGIGTVVDGVAARRRR